MSSSAYIHSHSYILDHIGKSYNSVLNLININRFIRNISIRMYSYPLNMFKNSILASQLIHLIDKMNILKSGTKNISAYIW